MDKRLLDILCCPTTKVPVTPLNKAQLEVLNRAIAADSVRSVTDAVVAAPLEAGLITTDGKLIYRIDNDIPVMLADEAIATLQLDGFPARR